MTRSKLKRFAELKEMQNAFDLPDGMQGLWRQEYFKNHDPITLELAAGKGDYSLNLAQIYAGKNFIAVDIQGERLWMGAKEAQKKGIKNVAFLRTFIDHITDRFAEEEIDEIWIVFPDPQPRKGEVKKRLTSPRFLDRYKRIIKKEGKIHLKTDNLPFFEYTLESLKEYGATVHEELRDIYSQPKLPQELEIKTYFEEKHLKAGRKINYLCFSL